MEWGITLWLLAASCQTLDAVTTVKAMERGYVDANPIMRNGGWVVGVKVSVGIGSWFVWKQSSKPVRHIIPAALAVNGCAGGIHNLRRLQ